MLLRIVVVVNVVVPAVVVLRAFVSAVVAVVVMATVVARQLGHRAGTVLEYDELAHHALVLVPQQVAVVHVGHRGVGVVTELHDHADRNVGRQVHGVLPAAQVRRRRVGVRGGERERAVGGGAGV